MKPYRFVKQVVLLLSLTITTTAFAAPHVVVSQPAIHSLVANLMDGVGEPDLLADTTEAAGESLDPFQISKLLTADLVIWVGAGLEGGVADTLQRFPAIRQRATTLSRTLPLLLKKGYNEIAADRQISRELTFWSDPKLAMMAVKQITPKLVRLDPDNTERYLDNEIRLLARIKRMQADISALLAPVSSMPEQLVADFDPYFSHRFLATVDSPESAAWAHKVANQATPLCPASGTVSLPAGPDLYFKTLATHAERVMDCANRIDPEKRLVKQSSGTSSAS